MRFTLVPRPFRRLFRHIGLAGITMPWQTVYLMPEHWLNDSLRCHEAVHIEQIRRDGAFMFSVKYLWWLCRYGYWKNPYEIEAYGNAPITATET
jgi:hypothetical protein